MALVHDDDKTFYDDLVTKVELAVQPASAVEAKPLRNLAGEVELEFVALVADGAQVVVTRPRDDWSYEDFRLFFGRADRLDERAVSAVSRGSSTQISFALAGAQAEALFASPQLSPNALSTLSQSSGDLAMTLLPTGTGVPSGWKFRCLP